MRSAISNRYSCNGNVLEQQHNAPTQTSGVAIRAPIEFPCSLLLPLNGTVFHMPVIQGTRLGLQLRSYFVPRRSEVRTALNKKGNNYEGLQDTCTFPKNGTNKWPEAIGTIKLPERQINGSSYTNDQ